MNMTKILCCHLLLLLFAQPVMARWRFFGGGGRYAGGGGRGTGNSSGGLSSGAAIALWLSIGISVLIALFGIFRYQQRKRRNAQQFRDQIKKARDKVLQSNRPRQVGQPTSGVYHVTYEKPARVRREKDKKLNLVFELEDNGIWKITGSGESCVGQAIIRNGAVSNTGEAFWIEEVRENHMLSMGGFNFADSTFEGEWLTRRGQSGKYKQFSFQTTAENGIDVEMARPL